MQNPETLMNALGDNIEATLETVKDTAEAGMDAVLNALSPLAETDAIDPDAEVMEAAAESAEHDSDEDVADDADDDHDEVDESATTA